MPAGDSAHQRARDARREIERLQGLASRSDRGGEGEELVAASLRPLADHGWTLLEDRRWSPHSEANIDLIAVGPGGVVVVDAKYWHVGPWVRAGTLMRAEDDCSAELDRLRAAARSVAESIAPLGISPVAVAMMMAFAGHRVHDTLGAVRLVGAREAATAVAALPIRFTPEIVRTVAARVQVSFPAHLRPSPAPPSAHDPTLFDLHQMLAAHDRSVRQGPIEEWMTFLKPEQHGLVRRDFGGPARISGAAGTGKTVVGLHRAAELAMRGHGPVLFVTFVGNLARVQARLLARLAPAARPDIEVRTLHSLAARQLNESGWAPSVDGKAVDRCFADAWRWTGRALLDHIDRSPPYWQDEIRYVIKGRGFTTFDEYRQAERHGRRTPLRDSQREAVWQLYTEYERLRQSRGLWDFDDLLLLALDRIRRAPASARYASVIVDEAQDLSLTGLRLVHALVGDRPNGLLLIGDAQQAVYPGGYRLADAGISIRGARSTVLRDNYRNGPAILTRAAQVVAGTTVRDVDGTELGAPAARPTKEDGLVSEPRFMSADELERALVAEVRRLAEPAATAVLCADNQSVNHYLVVLRAAGLLAVNLEDYDGVPTVAVKVGTFARGKGLEFKHVLLPGYDRSLQLAAIGGLADADRLDRATNQLYVAMTRARDTLWLATVG